MSDLEYEEFRKVMEAIQQFRDEFIEWEIIKSAVAQVEENEGEDAYVRHCEAAIRNYYSAP